VKDVIVSIRIPKSLHEKLQALAKKNHYLDLSEEIRSVIRDKTAHYANPYTQNVKHIVDDLQTELAERKKDDKREHAISQLKKILHELEHE
jgi:Arc/MetJ-type ribon-helix-helix transcriptional regulator